MIQGKTMVGYRYGAAPESGVSYNTMTGAAECGVSMAAVGHMGEMASFAIDAAARRRKYYYMGTIAGEGGDGEICLAGVKQISGAEFRALRRRADIVETCNQIVNDKADRLIALIRGGWSIGRSIEQVEKWRRRNIFPGAKKL